MSAKAGLDQLVPTQVRRTAVANEENKIQSDDVNSDARAEATEELRDLEPKKDVKGGRPLYV